MGCMLNRQTDYRKSKRGLLAVMGEINLCACGQSVRFWEVLRNTLRIVKEHKPLEETIVERMSKEDLAYTVLTLIDMLNLTEHGGSVMSQRLEQSGESVLELLETHGIDSDLWPIEWYEHHAEDQTQTQGGTDGQ